MGRKTREKGTNYNPISYDKLLTELNSKKKSKKTNCDKAVRK